MNSTTQQNTALFVASLAAFLTPFMGSAVNVALPSIGWEFSVSALVLSWIQTAYMLTCAMAMLPFGRMADIYGRRRFFVAGAVITAISSLLAALAPGPLWLIAARAIQGFGGAMTFGTATAILTDVFPPGKRGWALGFNVAAVYAGLMCGPFVGGVITDHLGWRAIFWIHVPLGALIVAVAQWKLPLLRHPAKGERFDIPGAAVYSLALPALMFGFSHMNSRVGAVLTMAGVGLLAVFVWLELRARHPLLDVSLFLRNPVFGFSNLAAFLNYSSLAAVGFLLSLYLQAVKGMSAQKAGLILIAQPLVMMLISPIAGRLSDRVEPRIVSSAGMALTVAGLLMLLGIGPSTSVWRLIPCLVVLGAGVSLFSSPNTNAVMSSIDARLLGVASATIGTMRLTGNMFSMGIVMLIFSVMMDGAEIVRENAPTFMRASHMAFAIFAALCFVGIFASLARGNVHPAAEVEF